MTREVAKREIDSIDYYLQNHTDDYGEESHTAMMMAIQALEQQTSEDAVSRQVVLEVLKDKWNAFFDANDAMQESIDTIEALLPVNPQGTGHWIAIDEEPHEDYECDKCGYVCSTFTANIAPYEEYKYCPSCGAKMVEPQESEET